MADCNFLNRDFLQRGPVCAMGCYGIVIEYFSDNEVTVEQVLDAYVGNFDVRYTTMGPNRIKNKHEAISKDFHQYCHGRELRGFEFIQQLHNNDVLETRCYGDIILGEASMSPISEDSMTQLREQVKENDALAMVLYKVNPTNFHAIVVGFDEDSDSFFYKDPEIRKIQFADILETKIVTEFIIFNDLKTE